MMYWVKLVRGAAEPVYGDHVIAAVEADDEAAARAVAEERHAPYAFESITTQRPT